MNANHHTRTHVPGSECAALAAALPLLDDEGLDARDAARAREHVATCAYCQDQAAAYKRLDAAMRRHFGPAAVPPLFTEDIVWSITGIPEEEIVQHLPERSALVDAPAPTLPPEPPAPPPLAMDHSRHGPRRFVSWMASVAAVLTIALLAQLLFASHGHRPQPLGKAAATPVVHPPETELTSVAIVSPTEGWAVGERSVGTGNVAVIYHYTGGLWAPVSVPWKVSLQSVSAVSPSDVWAVGSPSGSNPGGDPVMILHYNGSSWAPVSIPPSTGMLQSIDMVSANEGWAVSSGAGLGNGGPYAPNDSAILHYQAGTWTPQPVPPIPGFSAPYTVDLYGVSMLSVSEGWAVGEAQSVIQSGDSATSGASAPTGVILQYTGGQWKVQRVIASKVLRSVSMVTPTEGWAVGETDTFFHNPYDPNPNDSLVESAAHLLLHYTGGQWHEVAKPVGNPVYQSGTLGHIVMVSAAEGWAVGDYPGSYDTQPDSADNTIILLHYSGGRWTQVRQPVILHRYFAYVNGIAMVSASEGWAVGSAIWPPEDGLPLSSGGFEPKITPLILHYLNGTWSVYAS
jgi:hypothetical protein